MFLRLYSIQLENHQIILIQVILLVSEINYLHYIHDYHIDDQTMGIIFRDDRISANTMDCSSLDHSLLIKNEIKRRKTRKIKKILVISFLVIVLICILAAVILSFIELW